MKSEIQIIALLGLTVFLVACTGEKPVTNMSTSNVTIVKPKQQPQLNQNDQFNPPPKLSGIPDLYTVDDILRIYGKHVERNLKYYFTKAKVSYPPREITFVALKQEKKLELWARDNGEFRYIRNYHIMGASGEAGPKLRQGDRQVPEGIYRITDLNPNSNYHLSMRINYPNEFDLIHAEQEGRSNLGSDIFIHGNSVSVGCLAMGDKPMEEIFVLTAQVGAEHAKVVIAPHDPRNFPLETDPETLHDWTPELYAAISHEIEALSPKIKLARPSLQRMN